MIVFILWTGHDPAHGKQKDKMDIFDELMQAASNHVSDGALIETFAEPRTRLLGDVSPELHAAIAADRKAGLCGVWAVRTLDGVWVPCAKDASGACLIASTEDVDR